MTDPYARRQTPPAGYCTQVWTDEHAVRRTEIVRYDNIRAFPPPDEHVEYDDEPLPDHDS